jgi:CheY-like chemotaxis protein
MRTFPGAAQRGRRMAGTQGMSRRHRPERPTVLVVGSGVLDCAAAASFLRDEGFNVIEVAQADEVKRILAGMTIDAIISDVNMPSATAEASQPCVEKCATSN